MLSLLLAASRPDNPRAAQVTSLQQQLTIQRMDQQPAPGMDAAAADVAAPAGQLQGDGSGLRQLQRRVLEGMGTLLDKQALQLRAQEAGQLRGFRERLAEVEAQLARERQAQLNSQDSLETATVSEPGVEWEGRG